MAYLLDMGFESWDTARTVAVLCLAIAIVGLTMPGYMLIAIRQGWLAPFTAFKVHILLCWLINIVGNHIWVYHVPRGQTSFGVGSWVFLHAFLAVGVFTVFFTNFFKDTPMFQMDIYFPRNDRAHNPD